MCRSRSALCSRESPGKSASTARKTPSGLPRVRRNKDAMIEVTKMRLKVLAWLALGLGSGHALAEDLMTSYKEALASDPVFQSARSSYEASKEKLPQGRALFL